MNMGKTFVNINITYYNTLGNLPPEVHYYYNDGVNPATSTWDELTVDEANRMMWELVKMGGTNTFKSNPYCSAICTREVAFWGFL